MRIAHRAPVFVAVGVVALGALVGALAFTPGDSTPAGASATKGPTRLEAEPTPGAVDVPLDAGIALAAKNGTLKSVEVRGPDGTVVPGELDAKKRNFTSDAPLAAATTYDVTATLRTKGGKTKTRNWTFTTLTPAQSLDARLTPGDDVVVGVGMPITLEFNNPVAVPNRVNVERRLIVTTSVPVAGAWKWVSDSEVRWRPRDYWPAHTDVRLDANLHGVDAGNGVWGAAHRTLHFQIGDSHVSIADAASHTMTVIENGQITRVMPISTGKASNPTMSGKHIVLEKLPKVIMDSSTNGVPINSPDGYYETVYWDVRISWSGEYVHSAPWSVDSQGQDNVSHGCINASPENAEWFYNFSQLGDIVEVVNTSKPPNEDGGVIDWKTSFDEWLHGSALYRQDPTALLRVA